MSKHVYRLDNNDYILLVDGKQRPGTYANIDAGRLALQIEDDAALQQLYEAAGSEPITVEAVQQAMSESVM